MPASQLTWTDCDSRTHSQQQHLFQRFHGAKRRLSADDDLEQHYPPALLQDAVPDAKRKCLWPSSRVVTTPMYWGDVADDDEERADIVTPMCGDDMPTVVNNNQPTHQCKVWQHSAHLAPPVNRVPSPWPSEQLTTIETTEGMETCERAPCPEVDEQETDDTVAIMAMDSDFTPDQNQYIPRHNEQDSNFCRQYCGFGKESPTSGRVRCYCKPSWEGMLNINPFLSDIY